MRTDVESYRSSAESTSYCGHPRNHFKIAEGFQLSRILLEIKFYDRYFNVTIESLATSWAGRWILLRSGFWMRALKPNFTQSEVKPFRLVNASRGKYVIEGSCCSDLGELSDAEIQECNLGRMLVAEKSGEWKGFFAFVWCRIVRRVKSCVRLVLG